MQEKLGACSFWPFIVVLVITMIFVLVMLPETKGEPTCLILNVV